MPVTESYATVEAECPLFLNSALDKREWSGSGFSCSVHGEIFPGTHWIRGQVGTITGMRISEKDSYLPLLPWIETQILSCPTSNVVTAATMLSQYPYHPGNVINKEFIIIGFF